MKSKFDLIYENIMDILNSAKVEYTLLNEIVQKHLSQFLNIPIQELGEVSAHVASVDEYQDYFGVASTDEQLEQVYQNAENTIIVDLNKLPASVTAEDIARVQADNALQKAILKDIHCNGQQRVNRVLFIDD